MTTRTRTRTRHESLNPKTQHLYLMEVWLEKQEKNFPKTASVKKLQKKRTNHIPGKRSRDTGLLEDPRSWTKKLYANTNKERLVKLPY